MSRRCAIDIGGTLAKVAIILPETDPSIGTSLLKSPVTSINGLNCDLLVNAWGHAGPFRCDLLYFKTSEIDHLIEFFRSEGNLVSRQILPVTGGGAHKFQANLEEALDIVVEKHDEIASAMRGLSLLLQRYDTEVFRFDANSKTYQPLQNANEAAFPLGLVNVGSGVSILKATSPTDYTRISGTCIGGGTVMGLARLLVQARSFQEVCDLAAQGTNELDLCVGDISGDSAGSSCLPKTTLASSFGRLYVVDPSRQSAVKPRREDIAKSLVTMVSYNLGYLAYLLGRIHAITRFVFTGKYINHQIVTLEDVAHALSFYHQYYDAKPIPKSSAAVSGNSFINSTLSDRPELGDNQVQSEDYGSDNGYIEDPLSPSCLSPSHIEGAPNMSTPLLGGLPSFQTANLVQRQARNLATPVEGDGCAFPAYSCSILNPSQSAEDSLPPFEVLSLRHDGYLGAVGALLLALELRQP